LGIFLNCRGGGGALAAELWAFADAEKPTYTLLCRVCLVMQIRTAFAG